MKNTKVVILFLLTLFFTLRITAEDLDYTVLQKIYESIRLSFDDFPTSNVWNKQKVEPILDTPRKINFRTILRQGAKKNPNFNGIYSVVEFGCGTSCQSFFVINLESGIVYEGFVTTAGVQYTAESYLFIANPISDLLEIFKGYQNVPGWNKTIYSIWNEDHLKDILIVNPESSEDGK